MIHLIKKDLLLNRWLMLIGLAFGLILLPTSLFGTGDTFFFVTFINTVFIYLIFTMNRQAVLLSRENRLLLTLPLTRAKIVVAKYLFFFLCALCYPVYLSLIISFFPLFGAELIVPVMLQWSMLAMFGLLYYAMMLPLSFLNPRYSAWAGMLVYLGILILPQKLPALLGMGEDPGAFVRMLSQLVLRLQGWTLPVLALVVLAFYALSGRVSLWLYRKASF